MLGGVWDQDLLNALYAGSATYLHGHSVGGTNPSLLRAMGAGAPTIAWDVTFNREVLGQTGSVFSDPEDLSNLIETVEAAPTRRCATSRRRSAPPPTRWDDVAAGYERLCQDLRGRRARRPFLSARRTSTAHPAPTTPPAATREHGAPLAGGPDVAA